MSILPTPDSIFERAFDAGITMKALCKKAGISNSVFVRWRNGAKTRMDSVEKLIKALESVEKQLEE